MKRVLFLLVNSVCDIACTYCFYTQGYQKRSAHRVHPGMDAQLVERIAQLGFSTVILTGGYPLCRRYKFGTYRLIRLLKQYGLRVIVNTSAASVTKDDCVEIIESNVDRVDISIDSHIASIHNAQRGCYAEAVRTIKTLLERGYGSVVTTTVVTDANASTIIDTLHWLHRLGVVDTRIQRVFLPNEPPEYGSEIDRALRAASCMLSGAHCKQYLQLTEDVWNGGQLPLRTSCRMGKELFVCDSTGTLYPCFHREDLTIGNILTDATETINRALVSHELIASDQPPCFGKHCVSLFDNPLFWKEEKK